jgi:hypothetical protein
MNMHLTVDTLSRVREHFTKYPIACAGAATMMAVSEIESVVGFALPGDYKDFLLAFGAGVVGPYPIYGIGLAELMTENELSAWIVTRNFRKKKWPGAENWLVVSQDHAGNPVGIDCDGVVWISDHDFGGVTKLFDTFEQYLRCACLKLV